MLDHHLQRKIVYKLALNSKLRFSELKPDILENKLFTYHLKKVIAAGFVGKTDDGFYKLTPEGRRMGALVLDDTEAQFDRAYSVLFFVVRRKGDGAWLLYKRKTHPMLGKVGFMHGIPNAEEELSATAAKECQDKTGLNGTFKVLGSGFFRIYEDTKLESFTNFTLLVCEDAEGEILTSDEHAEYFWINKLDETIPDLLPNMLVLIEKYNKGEQFFLEETINY